MDSIFDAFDKGTLSFPETTDLAALPWTATAFERITLKHIITGAQTDGRFSFHLVRMAPHGHIGLHTHAAQLETHEVVDGSGHCVVHEQDSERKLPYAAGTLAFFPAGLPHEVVAGADGLYLLAKFFPSLC